jgi:hypothetical protein
MLKKLTLAFLFLVSVCRIEAQINVIKLGTSLIPATAEGLFYSLPQTVIKVDVIVNKIQKVKGPYSEYADQMLGLLNVTAVNSVEYELKDIRLSTYNEPDPSEYYFIQMPEKSKDRKTVELFLSDAGVIAGLDANNRSANQKNEKSRDLSSSSINIPEFANPSVFERTDTVIKRISLDSTIIEQKFFRKTSAAKTPEQKAREAAEFILKLDESMYNLIIGYQEVNYDKGTMEFMYSQMNRMKQDYLELFKGVTNLSSETFSFYFIIDKNNLSEILGRFSLTKGIQQKSATSGDLIQVQATSLNKTNALKAETEKLNKSQRVSHGLYYRIPDAADIVVKVGGLVKIQAQFIVNQLGVVTFLPSSTIGNILIDNNTGTLRRVVLE